MLSKERSLYRALCALLIVSLIALPVHATLGETHDAVCQQAPALVGTHAASADAEFIKAAAVDKLRPIGAAVTVLDDGSSLVTSVAKGQHQAERSGAMFFRRDALYAPGGTAPGMLSDTRLGMDPDRDVVWVKVTLSLPGNSSVKPASLEYNVEYRASELPAYQKLGTTEATALLQEWAATARPLLEQATVTRDGVPVASEDGSGSFEQAVKSLVPSSETAAPLKSRTTCRKGCQRYLGPGRFDVACVIVHALVCLAACYGSFGIGCAACLEWLGFDSGLCGYLGSLYSLFQYIRCYYRC